AQAAPVLALVRATPAGVEAPRLPAPGPAPVQADRVATQPTGEAAHDSEPRTVASAGRGSAGPAAGITSGEATEPSPAHLVEREPVPEVTPRLAGTALAMVVTSVQPVARVVSREDPVTLPRDRRRGVRLELTVGRSPGSLVESTARGIPSPAALGLPAHPMGGGIRRVTGGNAPPAPYAPPLGRW
ncbi:MAG TPA: hypothetical protein VGR27_03210, partial [Longimicrobiaceae bacterium]|nr:hypothetical protein [Longimicrobiaceae bacterium]